MKYVLLLLCLMTCTPAYAANSPWIFGANTAKLILQHVKVPGLAITPAAQSSDGSSGTCTVANADDVAGSVTITPGGTGISTGDVCELTFGTAYAVAPICVVSPVTSAINVDAVKYYVGTSTQKITINFGAAGTSAHVYTFTYYCVETQ